jgi:hypothetical protein
MRRKKPGTQDYYVWRRVKQGGKWIAVFMAREVLGLPYDVGQSYGVGDHKNHDTTDNTIENLRIATNPQNIMNGRKWGSCRRFKGVIKYKNKYIGRIYVNDSYTYFPSVLTEIEAGLMHFYAAYVLHGEFVCTTAFPEDEMPIEERQQELWCMVVEKLGLNGLI